MKPNFLTWSLLLLLGWASTGWLLCWNGALIWHHSKRKATLAAHAETELLAISLPIDTFQKYKVGEHEIKLHGKFYDIKTRKINGSKIQLTVLADLYETRHIAFLKNILNHHQRPESYYAFLVKWLSTVFYTVPLPGIVTHPMSYPVAIFPSILWWSHEDPRIFSPPPESVLRFSVF